MSEKKEHAGYYRAIVEITQGDRNVSDFMAAAGLGLTGAGTPTKMRIDYKRGEDVDVARVSLAMDRMIAESDRVKTPFKILSYKVLEIVFVQDIQK